MTVEISYMGTKRQMAPLVTRLIADAPDGPFLDLFSGVCAVGAALGTGRPLWCNDAQHFASAVADAFFRSEAPPLPFQAVADLAIGYYRSNKRALDERFSAELSLEGHALRTSDLIQLTEIPLHLPNVAISPILETERSYLNLHPRTFPYRLFSVTFSGGYIGLAQAIQVDSIRYAIDALQDDHAFDADQHRWACLALCQALCKVSTTTGHFAQFLTIKERNKSRFLAKRRRSVWSEWFKALNGFAPFGSRGWRQRNKVFRTDACLLLRSLRSQGDRPTVVYADPPYTKDQYSRYYHLYETLLLYDYPAPTGKSRNRADRFTSRFCLPTMVVAAFEEMISHCAQLGCIIILTYPTAGLLPDSVQTIQRMLRKHFRFSQIDRRLHRLHSSLGGSKGDEKSPAEEVIYLAR